MTLDRAVALVELMALPDPQELSHRSHKVTQEGKPQRFEMLAWLPAVYVNQRRQDLEDQRTA